MKAYLVQAVSAAAVNHLIREHYLGKWPGVAVATLGLFDGAEPIGVIVFALPPRETSMRYGVKTAWELARLFIRDCTPKNTETWFAARAIRWVRENHPEVELLISYADPCAGHVGTIYKAGSWISEGRTDQERKTPRHDYQVEMQTLFGVETKRFGRASHVPHGSEVQRVSRSSKHRFIYWMSGHEQKRQAARAR